MMLERPRITEPPEGPPRFEALLDLLLELDQKLPDGFRAEIVGGNIVVSPSSMGYYFPVMESIIGQLVPHAPTGHTVTFPPCLFSFPGQERAYGPDVYGIARKAFRTKSRVLDGEALSFVCELTSPSTRSADWEDKALTYGRAGVPVYLLVDMQDERTTAFWDPSPDGYTTRSTVPFGAKLHIPAPFDCELDTSEFLPLLDDEEEGEGTGGPKTDINAYAI